MQHFHSISFHSHVIRGLESQSRSQDPQGRRPCPLHHPLPPWRLNQSPMCLVTQSCLTLCIPMDYSPPGSSVHGYSSGKNTGVGCHALLQGLPNPGIKPRSPTLQEDSMLSEPPATDLINQAYVSGAFLMEDSIKNQTEKKRIGRASRLVNQNTSMYHTEWPQLQVDRSSFVRNLTLYLFIWLLICVC